jgi:hypothetical protein
MFVFIGNQYVKSTPVNVEGWNTLIGRESDNTPALCMDLGGFSTQLQLPDKEVIEIKNFFIKTSKKEFPKSVRYYEIDGSNYLLGQDAIDFASLSQLEVKPIFKDKDFYFDEINTFDLLKKVFEELDYTEFDIILCGSQTLTVKKALDSYFKTKNKEIFFINDTIAHLNSIIQLNKNTKGMIFDIGFESMDSILFCAGLAFESQRNLKGTRWVHEKISPTGKLDTELIVKEINKTVNINDSDGVNSLYKYFYESLFEENITNYFKSLEDADLIKLIDLAFPIYISGGFLEVEGVKDLIKDILTAIGQKYHRTFDIIFIEDSYFSMIKGLSSQRP